MNALRALERRLVAAERLALAALVAAMVLLSFAQVVLRSAFSSGILWADTFLRHLVLWVGFLGAGAAAAEDKQFAMDAAGRLLPRRAQAVALLLCEFFAAAVCLLLANAARAFLADERAASNVLFTIAGARVPAWPFELILPAGFALLSAHYLLKAALRAQDLRK